MSSREHHVMMMKMICSVEDADFDCDVYCNLDITSAAADKDFHTHDGLFPWNQNKIKRKQTVGVDY